MSEASRRRLGLAGQQPSPLKKDRPPERKDHRDQSRDQNDPKDHKDKHRKQSTRTYIDRGAALLPSSSLFKTATSINTQPEFAMPPRLVIPSFDGATDRHSSDGRSPTPTPTSQSPNTQHTQLAFPPLAAVPTNEPAHPAPAKSRRNLFKVSNFLNIRNSNFGQKKSSDAGSRAHTPVDSPMEPPQLSPWLEFKRRSSTRGSSKAGAEAKEKVRFDHPGPFSAPLPSNSSFPSNPSFSSNPSFQSFSSHAPSFHASNSNISTANTSKEFASSSALLTPTSTTRNHDWKQWDLDYDAIGSSFHINPDNFVWHRPSFRQLVESLQVAMVSGETIPSWQPGRENESNVDYSFSKSSGKSARPKRRLSFPLPFVPTAAGPKDPIPGRYRSHITSVIEGIIQMQDKFDEAIKRADEAQAARERDLEQFAQLSDEWAQRERAYLLEIQQLKEAALSASSFAGSPSSRAGRIFSGMSFKSGGDIGDIGEKMHEHESFLDRVKAAIDGSTKSLKPQIVEHVQIETRPGRPALITDLMHDKIVSDRLYWEMSVAERNKCRERGHWAKRERQRHPPAVVPCGLGDNFDVSRGVGAGVGFLQGGGDSFQTTAAPSPDMASAGALLHAGDAGDAEDANDTISPLTTKPKLKTKTKKKNRAKDTGHKTETGANQTDSLADYSELAAEETTDNPTYDVSPCQSPPDRAATPRLLDFETRPMRWSTSKPFSPTASDGDDSDDEDESDTGEERDKDGAVHEGRHGMGNADPFLDDDENRRKRYSEANSECTVVLGSEIPTPRIF